MAYETLNANIDVAAKAGLENAAKRFAAPGQDRRSRGKVTPLLNEIGKQLGQQMAAIDGESNQTISITCTIQTKAEGV